MEHIFYLGVAFCIIIEIIQIHNTKQCLKWTEEADKSGEKRLSNDCQNYVYMSQFYSLLCVIGLFSSQWYGFILILLLSIIPKRDNIIALKIDSFICLATLIFILLNKYHLHLELLKI